MLFRLCGLAALAAIMIPRVSASAPTDEYSDADPAQSGYLPNHNMDPAVVDSSSFGQLWKVKFNSLEQVRIPHVDWSLLPNHCTDLIGRHDYHASYLSNPGGHACRCVEMDVEGSNVVAYV